MSYRAPVSEMVFTLTHVSGMPGGAVGPEDAEAVLTEAGRLAGIVQLGVVCSDARFAVLLLTPASGHAARAQSAIGERRTGAVGGGAGSPSRDKLTHPR